MLYRTMPQNGDKLSILGFGAMRLPMAGGAIDRPRAVAQIRAAIDRGVNYVDTAWPYHHGDSEPLVGEALRDGYRDKVRLATKLPTWLIRSREDMDVFLNAQLARLSTDRIDYYLVHALDGPSWDRVAPLGVAEFLDAAKADGRIGNAGFSFHGQLADFKRIVDAYPWTFCQIQFNYLDQQFQAGTEGLKYAAAKGLGVIVMEPLRGGSLGRPDQPPAVAAVFDQATTRRTPVEWALRFVWNFPEVTLALSGMNEEAHIEQNLTIAEAALPGSLTGSELALVDAAARVYHEMLKVGCTGCGYCMPCPSGVEIPKCFDFYNQKHLTGDEQTMKFYYVVGLAVASGDRAPGFASNCAACGECLEKCPQGIQIPEVLARVAEEMEDAGMDERLAMAKTMFSARPD